MFVSIVFGRCLIEKVLVKSRVFVKKATSGVCPTRSWTNLPGDRTGTALGWRNFFIFGDFFYQARRLLRTLPAGFVQDGRFVWRRKSLDFLQACRTEASTSKRFSFAKRGADWSGSNPGFFGATPMRLKIG
ncbi:hypothetical protein CpipJ_CPIJ002370 [Culex quinquefasciatus]|uniref:Uncharacterized protein n=1 Tax=Culex quinquefasciatus TaxID=7176 RepID=B0W5Y0_CULQU|nr:hypothetical protein CpipJ_CPIJ002370 [Culex quinquefasciatus]|eukprot:XP_001844114.1 hypothetical protein CpipJ_CPIJ002370 [Culex quinquefasciatus]